MIDILIEWQLYIYRATK